MRTLITSVAIFLIWLLPVRAQVTDIGQDVIKISLPIKTINNLNQVKTGAEAKQILMPYIKTDSEFSYNNCAEDWPDHWRRHVLCTDYPRYAWQDTVILATRSLLQNWNTGSLNINGSLKYVVPPPEELVFNLIIINASGDTVYNRLTYYQLIGENWSFNIGFLVYVYTQENILIPNPVPGLYTVKSIIKANQFTNHTVTLNFSIDNPVPVELISFTAKADNNDITLTWVTTTEINTYGYTIERQGQGESYLEIGFITGNGNSNSPKNYNFTDANLLPGSYLYRLKQIDFDGSYEYYGPIEIIFGPSLAYKLWQNYPNPFNPVTTINYSLSEARHVKLIVYNILGQMVAVLVDQEIPAGNHLLTFNTGDLPGGTYYYQLQADNYNQVKKMVIIK